MKSVKELAAQIAKHVPLSMMQKDIIPSYSARASDLHGQFTELAEDIKQRGLKIVCETMPAKILDLNKALQV